MRKKILVLAAVLVIVVVSGVLAVNYYTARPNFCGTCHIMEKPYNSWKESKHADIRCVDCHYAPGEAHSLKARFKGLSQTFSYLATKETEVRKRTVVADASCTTQECHPYEKFMEEKYAFNEQKPYIHQTHEDKTIEGQKLHCNSCHVHKTAGKHFEVSKETCYLCHFKNVDFNEDRGRCTLCHELPTESLQSQKTTEEPGKKPITHQTLEEAKVPCWSCHYQLVQGEGEIKKEVCLDCHDAGEALKKVEDKKLMHQKHVADQNANCFNCHEPIQHKEAEFLDTVRNNCQACHPEHHIFQKVLLLGTEREDVPGTPGLMSHVKTNCLGCHVKVEHDDAGQEVSVASADACVACHTEEHDEMLKEWKDEMKEEVAYVKDLETEAEEAIASAGDWAPEEKLNEAMEAFKRGQELLRIVEYGNGVHNKKYSIFLIDAALGNFEDLIDSLQEEE